MAGAVVLAAGESNRIERLGLRDAGTGQLESLRIDDWERKLIREALARSAGNVAEAASNLASAARPCIARSTNTASRASRAEGKLAGRSSHGEKHGRRIRSVLP